MALDVDAITAVVFVFSMPKMVEACAKHVGQRSEGANVATEIATVFWVVAVRFDHHRHRVPTHVGAQTLFNFKVTRAMGFLVGFDGVDIAGIGRKRHVDAVFAGMF